MMTIDEGPAAARRAGVLFPVVKFFERKGKLTARRNSLAARGTIRHRAG
jgi:hypothetical protein